MVKRLHVSRSTIARDISELRSDATKWLQDMSEDHGQVIELKAEMDTFNEIVYNLRELRDKVKKPSEVIQINREIANISKKKWDLYRTIPLATSFKNFVDEHITKKKSGTNSRGMKIVPDDVQKNVFIYFSIHRKMLPLSQ